MEMLKKEVDVLSSNLNLSDPMDVEYLISNTKSHYDPSDIKSLDEIETLNDIMRKRNREKVIEEIKEWMIPTTAAITFIAILLLFI